MIPPVLIGRAHQIDAPGAATADGLTEWAISQAIQAGCMQELSRRDIVAEALSGTLAGRCTRARRAAACIIEPHCDWHSDPDVRGYYCIVRADASSRRLAACILAELAILPIPRRLTGICCVDGDVRWLGTSHQYAGAPRLGLLEDSGCPAVIVECCHLSNALDGEWISGAEHRLGVGACIARGIAAWLGQ